MRPVLEAAGLALTAVVTERRGHATELLLATKPDAYDMIVSIGG